MTRYVESEKYPGCIMTTTATMSAGDLERRLGAASDEYYRLESELASRYPLATNHQLMEAARAFKRYNDEAAARMVHSGTLKPIKPVKLKPIKPVKPVKLKPIKPIKPIKPVKPKRTPGRPTITPGVHLTERLPQIRCTPEQRRVFEAIGGAAAVRAWLASCASAAAPDATKTIFSEGDYYTALLDDGGVRVGRQGRAMHDIPKGHPQFGRAFKASTLAEVKALYDELTSSMHDNSPPQVGGSID